MRKKRKTSRVRKIRRRIVRHSRKKAVLKKTRKWNRRWKVVKFKPRKRKSTKSRTVRRNRRKFRSRRFVPVPLGRRANKEQPDHESGYEAGYDNGYREGFREGFNKGLEDGALEYDLKKQAV